MYYIVIIDQPGRTVAQFNEVLEALGPNPIEGQVAHAVGVTPEGLRHVELWRSREDAERFGRDRLRAAFLEVYGTEEFGPATVTMLDAFYCSGTVNR